MAMKNSPAKPRRIIVGISGASGAIYGIRLLQNLREIGVETHLVMSKSAEVTITAETDLKIKDVRAQNNIGAAISSGSFITDGMVVAPCAIRSVSEIASGVTSGLLTRAADVVLKERRRLVLMVRETPLHLGHLRTLTAVTEIGAIVLPPMPAFYNRPKTVDDIVNHTVARVLDLFGLQNDKAKRWTGLASSEREA